MIKKTIKYKRYRYLSVRVLQDTINEDSYDVTFTSGAWPSWRLWHKNTDELGMKELISFIFDGSDIHS